jgi:hypothetical protein
MAEHVTTLIIAATLAVVIGCLILAQALLTLAVHQVQRTLVAGWTGLRRWWRRRRGHKVQPLLCHNVASEPGFVIPRRGVTTIRYQRNGSRSSLGRRG